MNAHVSRSTAVVLVPRRAGLQAGQHNVVDVLVRIQAPDAPPGPAAPWPPQALALAIDRCGSTHGRPLDEARRCDDNVVGKLRPTDTLALVQFDDHVQRLWPAAPLGDGVALRAAIAGIRAGGNTHLHGGWREGVQSLDDGQGGPGFGRVILPSDGFANAGLTDTAAIAAECAGWAARGISTSTCGLGEGFNEELMMAMARAGCGNPCHGDSAEDLMDPFQQELELLGNLCLQELRRVATGPAGVELQMLNELPGADGGWRLPDLAWGVEAWAVLRLRVPAAVLPPPGEHLAVLRVTVEGRSVGGEAVTLERAGLALPVMSASTFEQLAEAELLARRLAELAAADALHLRAAAAVGDWPAVDRLLEEASRQFAGNPWVAALLAAVTALAQSRLREKMMKESMYSASRLNTRLSAKDEDIHFSVLAESTDRPVYLRRKRSQGKGAV